MEARIKKLLTETWRVNEVLKVGETADGNSGATLGMFF
jgi:hypothetical protein